jgi:hypothetical protein
MPDLIHVFAAFPIARNDDSADAACLAAEAMARTPPYCAAVAFTRLIDLVAGECSRSEIIMSFGEPAAREQWVNG